MNAITTSRLRSNLEFLMRKHGLTVSALATESGLPQPTVYRVYHGITKEPRDYVVEILAKRFFTTPEALLFRDLSSAETPGQLVLLPPPAAMVPIQITARPLGDGSLGPVDLDQPPRQEVEYASRDVSAYAVQIKGDKLRPRIRSGEILIVEPKVPFAPGEDVLVVTVDGTAHIREFCFRRDAETTLCAVNGNASAISISTDDHRSLHRIGAILPSNSRVRPIL